MAAIDIGTIMVLIILFAPVIEKILRAGRKPPEGPPAQRVPPPKQWPPIGARLPAPYERPQSSNRPEVGRGDASDMLPDDLWELVTGEKRPRVTTAESRQLPPHRHPAESTHSYDEEALDEESYATREQQPSREASLPTRVSTPYVPVHAPPVVVSLEDNIPTDAQRHVQFHERLSHLAPAAQMRVEVVPLSAVLASNAALRQAFIMAEVFGKPKGLE